MTNPPIPRRPRRNFPPAEARQIRIQNAAMAAGTLAYWLAMGAVLGRMMRWW